MKSFKVAVIAGDGIGKEVVPEGIRVVDAAGKRFGFRCEWTPFDWSCERYVATGKMMPDDGLGAVAAIRRDFSWGGGASRCAGPRFAMGIADPDPARVSAVREFAPGEIV